MSQLSDPKPSNNNNNNSSTSDPLNASALESVNNKLFGSLASSSSSPSGAGFPSVTVGGKTIRTGTVATLLYNIKLYNEAAAIADGVTSTADESNAAMSKMATLEEEMRLALPTLESVGMFDLFSADEWITNGSPGRAAVGKMAKQKGLQPHN